MWGGRPKLIMLRPFEPEDASACARLLAEGWRSALPRGRRRMSPARFAAETKGERIVVAAEAQTVVGFVSVYPPDAFIHHLYVTRSRRGRGVGRRLLEAGCGLIHGRPSLKCALGNAPARAFYARLGWREVELGEDETDGPWVRIAAPLASLTRGE